VWLGDVCRTNRGAVVVQTRIDRVDKVKATFDGAKVPTKMRGVRRQQE